MTVSLDEFLDSTSETICRRKLMIALNLTGLTFNGKGCECEPTALEEQRR